ncbi:MAG: serine hydrolase [Bacteroidetes bacterium]|nr:serine hydrolase [Fibrella sp.]
MTPTAFAQSLPERLTAYLNTLPPAARVSIAVESLGMPSAGAGPTIDSVAFFQNADVLVPSASVIKLPILIEAMTRIQAGTLDPDEIHILVDSEKAGGSGTLRTYQHRSRIPYRDLLAAMMIQSDNTATNIFITELSLEAINRRMQTLGLTKSRLNRPMMDTLAAKQGRENVVTAREMNDLLKKMYYREIVTPALCDQILDLLKRNEDTLTIPRDLPPGTIVAHKTGELPYVRADAGIIYARKPFVLSVLVEGLPTPDAERIIGRLARLCFDYFQR